MALEVFRGVDAVADARLVEPADDGGAALQRSGVVRSDVVHLDVQAGDPAAPAQRPEVLHADLMIDALWQPVNDVGAGR